MIDFANKAITTKSDLESEQLLKKAVAQGFGLPKGEKALITNRFFRFIGSPYKQILIPSTISHTLLPLTVLSIRKREMYFGLILCHRLTHWEIWFWKMVFLQRRQITV